MQILPKVLWPLGFGDSFPQTSATIDGMGPPGFGTGGAPMVLPGVMRRLVLYDGMGFPQDIEIEVYKNLAPSGLGTFLAAGAAGRQAFDDTTQVSFLPGDRLTYYINNTSFGPPGFTAGVCVEITSSALLWGIGAHFGTVFAGTGIVGSAFGNGFWASYGGDPRGINGSICAINGTISKLGLKRDPTDTGGSWRLRIIKNGFLHDGIDASPDSTVLVDDTESSYRADTIAIPCTIWDRVSILCERLGATGQAPGVGLAFTPSIAGQFMICEGDNNEISVPGTNYKWTNSPQTDDLGDHTVPMGRSAVSVNAMYVDHEGAGTNTLLKNGLPTGLTTSVLLGDNLSEDTGHTVSYAAGDLATMEMVDGGNRIFFSLAMSAGSPQGNIGPIAWLNRTRRVP